MFWQCQTIVLMVQNCNIVNSSLQNWCLFFSFRSVVVNLYELKLFLNTYMFALGLCFYSLCSIKQYGEQNSTPFHSSNLNNNFLRKYHIISQSMLLKDLKLRTNELTCISVVFCQSECNYRLIFNVE